MFVIRRCLSLVPSVRPARPSPRLQVSRALFSTGSQPSKPVPVTVAHGDGIGPEIMDATLRIVQAAGANLALETIEIGEKVCARFVWFSFCTPPLWCKGEVLRC
jgi:hypothetical protein